MPDSSFPGIYILKCVCICKNFQKNTQKLVAVPSSGVGLRSEVAGTHPFVPLDFSHTHSYQQKQLKPSGDASQAE